MERLQPPDWIEPKGYANGMVAKGRLVFVAGQVGWNARGELVDGGFVAQARQALANIVAVLAQAGGKPSHLVRLTWYVADRDEYLRASRELGVAYREVIGRHYPAMTAVQVAAFVEAGARVEIEATAVIPDD
ncbi:MAG TPA: RidA family protein [Casimicrobiaceae bacterium]|nr:RidA family protein [Casimicrobiaceae bacterium]